jgi:hypothetical protein
MRLLKASRRSPRCLEIRNIGVTGARGFADFQNGRTDALPLAYPRAPWCDALRRMTDG